MKKPLVRQLVRAAHRSIAGGRDAAHLERPARPLPRRSTASRPATPTTPAGARSPSSRRDGVAHLHGRPRRARRAGQRNADLRELLGLGLRPVRPPAGRRSAAHVRDRARSRSRTNASARRRQGRDVVLPTRRARSSRPWSRPRSVELPVRGGPALGEVRVMDNGKRRRAAARSWPPRRSTSRASADKACWYSGQALSEAGDMMSNLFGSIL